jgi:ZIP family zinc transporter
VVGVLPVASHDGLALWADVIVVFAAGVATALATGLGAIPVFALGERASSVQPFLYGLAVGLMGVASIVGLLLPAIGDGGPADVAAGLAGGVAFFVLTRMWLDRRDARAAPLRRGPGTTRAAALVFAVLLVHSLPEGLAIGTAYGAGRDGLGLFVILAIALQNVPEGTAAAIPLHAAGASRRRQFWLAVATSAPQPVGAVFAVVLVEQSHALLPLSLAFAAGAMLALVAAELAPQALATRATGQVVGGTLAGAALMLALAAVLGT